MSQQEEEPLDPAVEAIRVKMVRLLAISGGIMMLGLMAVLVSIVYKVTQDSEPKAKPVAANPVNEVVVPAGSQIMTTSHSDGRLMLTLKLADGSTQIQLHDLQGKLITTYAVREQ